MMQSSTFGFTTDPFYFFCGLSGAISGTVPPPDFCGETSGATSGCGFGSLSGAISGIGRGAFSGAISGIGLLSGAISGMGRLAGLISGATSGMGRFAGAISGAISGWTSGLMVLSFMDILPKVMADGA